MQTEEIQITNGENIYQNAVFELNDKTIEYETSHNLSYADIISLSKGLDIISEFYDVSAAVTVNSVGICAVALGKTAEDAIIKAIDSDPIDYMSSTVVLSNEVNSDIVKMLKGVHLIAAPKYTKNAKEYLDTHQICYVTIITPLKDYKKFLSNKITVTPLGTLTQEPNLSELKKDSFKVETKTKPSVEQIEDAVFAWKVAKHSNSRAIVVAKDLRTRAISQGLQAASIEYVLDYSCDGSKDAILATDMGITLHDINVAAQGRISVIILPSASKEIISAAEKFNIIIISTGFTNIKY